MEASLRAPVGGPTFIRLLARLAEARIAPPEAALPDRLGEWIDWNRAVALSRALDGAPPAADAGADSAEGVTGACARERAALADAIASERGLPPAARAADGQAEPADAAAAFLEYHRKLQQAMQAGSGRLRGQLRDALAAQSPRHARLAEVDAVLEAALSPREHALLATVPALLGRRLERLRQEAASDGAPPGGATAAAPPPWIDAFRKDLRHVLQAELDVRFQPIDALLAALRSH